MQVGEMMSDIRSAFVSLVHEADWMDEETMSHALRKVQAMGLVIAYPDFFLTPGYVEDQFKGVSTTRNKLYDI
jgi:endothelin-converting enzyme/membrane metallo-endopeptidase-like protein 1